MTISSEGESHRLQMKVAGESVVPSGQTPLPQTELVRHLKRLATLSKHSQYAWVLSAMLEKMDREHGRAPVETVVPANDSTEPAQESGVEVPQSFMTM